MENPKPFDKRFRRIWIGLSILVLAGLLAGCGLWEGRFTYRNKDFGFSVSYPFAYKAKRIGSGGADFGLNLEKPAGIITVQAMAAGTDYAEMPFAEYVLIAAASEIQNFEKLESLTRFVSASGVAGYKTFWQVVETLSPEEQNWNVKPARKIVGPIYYFPPRRESKYYGQPVKTIMISAYAKTDGDKNLNRDLEQIARSFRY